MADHALDKTRRRKKLIEEAEARGLQPEQLDELVHEAAAANAARINNGGLDEQIEYLVEELGLEEVERLLASLPEDE